MPRSPSARCLSNTVSLYHFAPSFDADGGIDPTVNAYATATATNVPASVQLQGSEDEDFGERPTRVNRYLVFFKQDYALGLKDLIVWVDSGVTHSLYVDGQINAAGKGSNWAVTATERL